jgi:hypothetical protein
MKQVMFTLPAHLPSGLLLLRQRCIAACTGLGTGLGTTIKYVRRTAIGAAGNGLGITIKCLRHTRNGNSGNGPGTTIKYQKQLPRATAWPPR